MTRLLVVALTLAGLAGCATDTRVNATVTATATVTRTATPALRVETRTVRATGPTVTRVETHTVAAPAEMCRPWLTHPDGSRCDATAYGHGSDARGSYVTCPDGTRRYGYRDWTGNQCTH